VVKDTVVDAEKREGRGKNDSRRARRDGKIPAVLYGAGAEAIPLLVDPKSVQAILHSEAGENTLFAMNVPPDGTLPGKFMIKDHQVDPITDRLLHADFLRIAMDRAIRVQVSIRTLGVARGVKLQGGILEHPMREVEVECLPQNIPEHIDVDITELDLGRSYRVSDLKVDPSVRILTDPQMPVVAVVAPTVEKVAEPTAEGAVAAEAPTEPELIKKGKAESAEDGAAPEKESKGGKAEKK